MGVFRFSFVECKTDGISQSRLVIFDSYLVEFSEIYLHLYFMVERYWWNFSGWLHQTWIKIRFFILFRFSLGSELLVVPYFNVIFSNFELLWTQLFGTIKIFHTSYVGDKNHLAFAWYSGFCILYWADFLDRTGNGICNPFFSSYNLYI